MFKVGDKVVCVNGYYHEYSNLHLEKGKIYVVKAIENCKCTSSIDVGVTATHPTKCYTCGKTHSGVFHKQIRFRKLDESFAEGVLAEIKEQIEEEELVKV